MARHARRGASFFTGRTQAEHRDMSQKLFEFSWREHMNAADPNSILATGFSCRCQTERFAGFRPRHPAEGLMDVIRATPLHPGRLGADSTNFEPAN